MPGIKEIFQMGMTFLLVLAGWVFFRADSIGQAFEYLKGIADKSLFSLTLLYGKKTALTNTVFIASMLIVEWIGRNNQFGLEKIAAVRRKPCRWIIYLVIVLIILTFLKTEETPFIYFQF